MADLVKELGIKVTIDSSGVEAGAAGVGTALEGAGKKGAEGLELTSAAARDVEAYLKRIEAAGVAPDTLTRNAEKAAAALEVLRKEAEASGTEIPEKFAAAGAAIDAAKERAAAMSAELARIGQTPTKLDVLISELRASGEAAGVAVSDVDALSAAMTKLEAAGNSPRALRVAVRDLELALEDVRTAAKNSGTAISGPLADAMHRAEEAATSGTARLGRAADAMGDIGVKGRLGAEGARTLATSGGSLVGIFSLLDDGGKGFVSTLGKVGLGAFAAVEVWKMMREAGQALDLALSNLSDKQNKLAQKTYDLTIRSIELDAVLRRMPLSFDPVGKSAAQLHEAFLITGLGAGRLRDDMKKLAEGAGLVVPSLAGIARQSTILGQELAGAFKRGHAEGMVFLEANAGVIRSLLDLEAAGAKIDPSIHKYADSLKIVEDRIKLVKAETDRLKNAQQALESAVTNATKAMLDAAKKSATDTQAAYDTQTKKLKELNAALNENAISLEEHSRRKKEIEQETTAAVVKAYDEQETAGKTLQTSIEDVARQYGLSAEETKKLIVAMDQQTNQFKTSREEQGKVSDVARTLAESVKKQADAMDQAKTPAQAYSDALHGMAEKAKELGDASPRIGEAVEAIGKLKDGTAVLNNEGTKNFQAFVEVTAKGGEAVKVSLDGVNKSIDATIKKLGELKKAADGAIGAGS